jgi:energy-coupling factor transporter ATP-binding protein EcfA2
MYISRVRVENIRGFHGPRNVDLDLTRPDGSYAGWTVIAGRNGSGKTTLLRAIALAMASSGAAYGLMPDAEEWPTFGETHGVAELSVNYLDSAPGNGFSCQKVGAEWFRLPETDSVSWGRWVGETEQSGPEFYGVPDKHALVLGYGPFRRISKRGVGNRPMKGALAALASLFYDDVSLEEGVTWLIDQHTRSLDGEASAERTKQVALALLADGLLPDGFNPTRLSADGLWIASNGSELLLRQMSDGYSVVVGLVVDIIRRVEGMWGDLPISTAMGFPEILAPGIVLIDEIDAHLHISWQQRIGDWLKRHFPNIQFIVTTHSPYICQAADEGGLISLPGPTERTAPRVVERDLYERVVFGTGDDAVLSELFGVDTPFSARAEKLREELVRLEFLVLDGEADDEQKERYGYLRDLLTSSLSTRMDEIAARLRPDSGGDE